MFWRIGGLGGAMLAAAVVSSGPAASQQAAPPSPPASTSFCLADGTRISAERFETRDGKFFFYVPGGSAPLEYPAESVKGINVADCGPLQAPPPRFGIYGSNTIGERLMPMLIEAYGEKRLQTRPAIRSPKVEELEITVRQGPAVKALIDFQAHGSGTAAKGLLDGKAVIGMASRSLKPDEAAALQAKFNVNPLAPGSEHVLALDGLAVIVNAANPVKSLSLEQIARIFSGSITRWSQVGGPDAPITVLRRDEKSGTFDTFKSLVLDPASLPILPTAEKFESSENLSATVAKDPNAIGFIGLPYINKNHAIALVSSCGLADAPSRFTVKTEQYPLTRRLFLYTAGTPSEPAARDILQFALSDEAQPVIGEAGFVDQAVEFQDDADQQAWLRSLAADPTAGLEGKEVPREGLAGAARALSGLRRTSIVFRFAENSAQLDTRALQDVQRLARYLAGQPGKPLLLLGFADATGNWRSNFRLARERAVAVAAQLKAAGVRVGPNDVASLSYLAPVACNDAAGSRAKNRRVEVWMGR